MSLLKRTMDARHINEVANNPDVAPWLFSPNQAIDLAPIVSNTKNVCLTSEHGAFVCVWVGPATYDVHSLFVREGRGAHVLRCAQEGLGAMFLDYGARHLVTKTPISNVAAEWLTKRMAFRSTHMHVHPKAGACVHWALSDESWARGSDLCLAEGQRFHDAIGRDKHDGASFDDEVQHNQAVGMALLRAIRGRALEAVQAYNEWALVHGYQPASVIGCDPLVVDMGDGLLGMRDGDWEVLSCL